MAFKKNKYSCITRFDFGHPYIGRNVLKWKELIGGQCSLNFL